MGLFRPRRRYDDGYYPRRRGPGAGFIALVILAYFFTGGRKMIGTHDKSPRHVASPAAEAAPRGKPSTGKVPPTPTAASAKAPRKKVDDGASFDAFQDAYRKPSDG
jgi:hypothetical protein